MTFVYNICLSRLYLPTGNNPLHVICVSVWVDVLDQCGIYYCKNIVKYGCQHSLQSSSLGFYHPHDYVIYLRHTTVCLSALSHLPVILDVGNSASFHSSKNSSHMLVLTSCAGLEANSVSTGSDDNAVLQRPEPWNHRGQTHTEPSDNRQRCVVLLIRQGSKGNSQEDSLRVTV